MIYLISGGHEVVRINKLFMGTPNAEFDADYVFDKICRGLNEYMDIPTMTRMLEDVMLGITNGDADMMQAFMPAWVNLIIKLHYYIVTEDIMLPFISIKLERGDIRAITAME